MSKFKEIDPDALEESVFKLIGSDWALIASKTDDGANAMTASWGGMGVMWGKKVAYIVIRPSRYTKEFVDKSGRFSLNFFDESYRDCLNYMGSVSGRTENKIEKANLSPLNCGDSIYFAQSRLAMLCKTLYVQTLDPAGFKDADIDARWYPQKDYHTLYITEVEKVFVAEQS